MQPAVSTGVSSSSGLASAMLALAPADQSVAYLLGADGAIVRTLSAGRQPATARVDKARIRAGATTRLSARVRIAAPGDLLVQSRVPGKPWQTEQTIAWTPADWDTTRSWSFSPSLTHDYALSFRYGGTTVPLTAATRVVVVPKVLTARSRYDLRRGAIFRFSGTVAPRLNGERIQLYTDRGGKWRPISLQQAVKLKDGRRWTSRRFGTPAAEKYHLRAHIAKTRTHAEAWSRVVTVSIR